MKMAKPITRKAAIELIAQHDLKGFSPKERAEELYCLRVENWEYDPDWQQLPKSLRQEIETGEFDDIVDPSHTRFDQALIIPISSRYQLATNAYLFKLVQKLTDNVSEVTGVFQQGINCPCCGLQTLTEQGVFDVCEVCWWEDDGQDNVDALRDAFGPNRVSLTQARINYLMHGISEPERTDLFEFQYPAERFAVGRKFIIDEKAGVLYEQGTKWRCSFK